MSKRKKNQSCVYFVCVCGLRWLEPNAYRKFNREKRKTKRPKFHIWARQKGLLNIKSATERNIYTKKTIITTTEENNTRQKKYTHNKDLPAQKPLTLYKRHETHDQQLRKRMNKKNWEKIDCGRWFNLFWTNRFEFFLRIFLSPWPSRLEQLDRLALWSISLSLPRSSFIFFLLLLSCSLFLVKCAF